LSSVLDQLFGIVDVSKIDLFEFIESDEARELLAVPIYKSFRFRGLSTN
jgi:hypothetical protein